MQQRPTGRGLHGEQFVHLLRKMMKGRRRPIHLVLDGLPSHKIHSVRAYVDSLKDKLSLHFLWWGYYAPDLNPDELLWRYTKWTGVRHNPVRSGEQLADQVHI
ncbi:MAG: transposase [Burkholderia sp.]|nr:MAG: hypothetical protein E5299_00361 [Burkholderia gladioli]